MNSNRKFDFVCFCFISLKKSINELVLFSALLDTHKLLIFKFSDQLNRFGQMKTFYASFIFKIFTSIFFKILTIFHIQTNANLYAPPWPHGSHSLSPPTMQPLSESPILELTEQMESI